MDIGTGKDLEEYKYEDKEIQYHLIDICEPGYKYNLYEYQRDFNVVFQDLRTRKIPYFMWGNRPLYRDCLERL